MSKKETYDQTSEMARLLFNSVRKRKAESTKEEQGTTLTQASNIKNQNIDDNNIIHEKLRNKAKEVILRESERGKERASRMGSEGWIRPPSLNTNKVFLKRMIRSTVTKSSKRSSQTAKSIDSPTGT